MMQYLYLKMKKIKHFLSLNSPLVVTWMGHRAKSPQRMQKQTIWFCPKLRCIREESLRGPMIMIKASMCMKERSKKRGVQLEVDDSVKERKITERGQLLIKGWLWTVSRRGGIWKRFGKPTGLREELFISFPFLRFLCTHFVFLLQVRSVFACMNCSIWGFSLFNTYISLPSFSCSYQIDNEMHLLVNFKTICIFVIFIGLPST